MLDKNILNKIKELKGKKNQIEKDIELAIKELQDACDHKNEAGDYTIQYDSPYEMRSSDMHCTQCHKDGSKRELMGKEGINNK